jgi:hypothetical protein
MIFILVFLLSWLSGLLVIFLFAFFLYESFSIVDITSFAVFTLAGCIILIPVFYLLTLNWLNKKITANKRFFYFPIALILVANLPGYFIIWKETNDLYGQGEAILFYLGFCTIAFVFGILWAWKNNILKFKKAK